MSENITVSKAFFEHLLACMANQKFIHDYRPDTDMSIEEVKAQKVEFQKTIDKAYDQGMRLLLYGEQPTP